MKTGPDKKSAANRRWASVLILGLVCVSGERVRGSDDPEVHIDGSGDAVIRRTDRGNNGPIRQDSTVPDLIRVSVGGWETNTPRTNRYSGSWTDIRDTDLIKIELEFEGLVNPPGPINLQGEGYDPYRYGTNPVYGYLELNLDRDRDTGGEIANIVNRPLGVASRFGGRLSDSIGERAPISGMHFDENSVRTGEEAHLSLCGCQSFTTQPQGDPTPNSFDAGDTWLLTGRFLQRTHAFSEYSFAFGGSETGAYDPVVEIRFRHTISTNKTTISFVYAKTQRGAAQLTGQAQQNIDLNAGNHTSIEEMLSEIRFAALNSYGPPGSAYDLLRDWGDDNHEDLSDFYDRDDWRVLTLFGMPYSSEQSDATYVWTDVGPEFRAGDCNGDRFVNAADQQIIMSAIGQSDGTAFDADGLRNGQTVIVNFALNFALFDLDYDGVIGAADLGLIGYERVGDVTNDGKVNAKDFVALNTMLGVVRGDIRFNAAADLDRNDVIDAADRLVLLGLLELENPILARP